MLFKKVIGEASFGQVSLIFTVIALLNTILLSPFVAALYFSGYEVVVWSHLQWPNLLIAAALSLGESRWTWPVKEAIIVCLIRDLLIHSSK